MSAPSKTSASVSPHPADQKLVKMVRKPKPAAAEAVVAAPAAAAAKPVIAQPAVIAKPVAAKPVAKPVVAKPVAKPVAAKPIIAKPVAASPAAAPPVAVKRGRGRPRKVVAAPAAIVAPAAPKPVAAPAAPAVSRSVLEPMVRSFADDLVALEKGRLLSQARAHLGS